MTPETSGSENQTDRLALWLEANQKNLIALVVVAFVVVLGTNYMAHAKQKKLEEANEALFKAAPPKFMAGMDPEDPDASGLQKVVSQFPGTSVAEQAALLAAESHYAKGDFEKALEAFQGVQKSSGSSKDPFTADFGVAVSRDALGSTSEAIQAYQAIIDKYSSDNRVHMARLSLGRLLAEQGKSSEALAVYDKIADSDLMNGWKTEASLRREALIQAHPELDTTSEDSETETEETTESAASSTDGE